MGEAKRRKKLDPNFGKSQPKKPKEQEPSDTVDLNPSVGKSPQPKSYEELSEILSAFDEEDSIYDHYPQLAQDIAELKASNMTLEKFRQEYSEDLDVIRIESDVVVRWGIRGKELQSYQGKALAVRYRGKDGPEELFPFPNADDPDAPVPPDVFDYLASFWVMFYPDPD